MSTNFSKITDDKGELLVYGDLLQKLDTEADMYTTIKELYGMVWFLAAINEAGKPVDFVKEAQKNADIGIQVSPGTFGLLPGSRA